MTKLPIVTLDGPAGVGKTTLAHAVADSLGLACLDTGAMFRCLALAIGESHSALDDAALAARLENFAFALNGHGSDTVLLCNGRPVGAEIRTERVAMLASSLATRAPVRAALAASQRAIGQDTALVAEGRDMGSVIFPNAAFKFFLDASPEVRARRRLLDLEKRGEKADLAELARQIAERDRQDRNRAIAPLRPAKDAMLVDTSQMDINLVLSFLLGHIRGSANANLLPAGQKLG